MRAMLVASVLLLPAVPVFAQDASETPVLYQHFTSSQTIEQSIDQGSEEGALLAEPTNGSVTLQQTGINALNVVEYPNDVGRVTQRFSGTQEVGNSIVAGALGALTGISQEGTNSANTIEGGTIELAYQIMGPAAKQLVDNSAIVGGRLSDVSQIGTNVANLAIAEHAIGVGVQEFHDDSMQHVKNHLDLAAQSTVAGKILQSGTNIGNALIADKVDTVIRRFDGTQRVENTVILNDGYRPRIIQEGNNVANLIIANDVGTIHQISTGSQKVINTVLDSDGQEVEHDNITQTESNYLGASNVVNLMIVGPNSNGGNGGSSEEMNITQEAEFDQSTSGNSSQSQSGNVLIINR